MTAAATAEKKARKARTDQIGPIRQSLQDSFYRAISTGDFVGFETKVSELGAKDQERTLAAYDEIVGPFARMQAPGPILELLVRVSAKLAPRPKIDSILNVNKRHTFLSVPKVEGLEDVSALKLNVVDSTNANALAAILAKGRKILVLEILTEAELASLVASVAVKVPPGPVPGQAPAAASAVARAA